MVALIVSINKYRHISSQSFLGKASNRQDDLEEILTIFCITVKLELYNSIPFVEYGNLNSYLKYIYVITTALVNSLVMLSSVL